MDKTIEDARQALYRFCKGEQRMCVPAQESDDDFLISKALDEYEKLLNIMERARRMAFLAAEEEEEDRPRFKMDSNGNLTRIEE